MHAACHPPAQVVCLKGATRCTAYKVTPSVEGLQSATQDAYLQSLGESALGGRDNKSECWGSRCVSTF